MSQKHTQSDRCLFIFRSPICSQNLEIFLNLGQRRSACAPSSRTSFPSSTSCMQATPTSILVQDAIQKMLSNVMCSLEPAPRLPAACANNSSPSASKTTTVVSGIPDIWSLQALCMMFRRCEAVCWLIGIL